MTGPEPLPSEEEADRFFTEVPAARSAAPSVHPAGAAPVTTTSTAAAPARPLQRTGAAPSGRRRGRLNGLAVLGILLALGGVWTAVAQGTSEPAPAGQGTVVRAGSDLPADFFTGRACVREMPATTDGPFLRVSCSDPQAGARVRGVTVLSTQDDVYPGRAEADRQARALCHLDFGFGIPQTAADVVVAVPSEAAWSARGARYVVCGEPLP